MTSIDYCPICSGNTFNQHLTCKDHTVSHETFQIKKCTNCSFLITSPRPDDDVIGNYYQSQDYISHTNKAASLIDKIYLLARNYTLNKKLRLINRLAPDGQHRLLDYGCGTGAFITYCKENRWEVNGVEPSDKARTIAEQSLKQAIHPNIESLVNDKYSIITLWHVLEHVPDLNYTLQHLSKCLEKSGAIIIAVPNYKSYEESLYKGYWAAYDVPRHLWHFSRQTMQRLAKQNGLRIEEVIPMKLDSYYISLLSEKYKAGKSTIPGMIKAFTNGLTSNIRALKTKEYSSLIYVIKK